MGRYTDDVTFTVKVTMRARWVPHFMGMLSYMQRLGSMGSSRKVTFFADGDGDFRPRFQFSELDPMTPTASPMKDDDGNHYYDAG